MDAKEILSVVRRFDLDSDGVLERAKHGDYVRYIDVLIAIDPAIRPFIDNYVGATSYVAPRGYVCLCGSEARFVTVRDRLLPFLSETAVFTCESCWQALHPKFEPEIKSISWAGSFSRSTNIPPQPQR